MSHKGNDVFYEDLYEASTKALPAPKEPVAPTEFTCMIDLLAEVIPGGQKMPQFHEFAGGQPLCAADGERITDTKRMWIAPDGRLYHNSDEAYEQEVMEDNE